ncbi:hypothetical protein B0H16DRAFT_1600714 [Mycena metata]|uniref:Uncharacterized protein n=1 Tax=Mycena metata TaxID=1033252 RepID=A0AAD7HJR9_9AGAR|nr:hypothetical protein B0H16DRAFT_1600714 [Mycena metata]
MDEHDQFLQEGNREIQILKALLRHTDNPILQDFTDHYVPLVKLVMTARLDESAKKLKAQAAYLTGLAGVASFLASVQIGFFPLIGAPDCDADPTPDGCNTHTVFIRALINFFSYLALSFDGLGALFALLTARSLLQASSDIQDLMDDKHNIDGFIWHIYCPNIICGGI